MFKEDVKEYFMPSKIKWKNIILYAAIGIAGISYGIYEFNKHLDARVSNELIDSGRLEKSLN